MFYYTVKKKKERDKKCVDGHIKISGFGLEVIAFQVCLATHTEWDEEPAAALARRVQ